MVLLSHGPTSCGARPAPEVAALVQFQNSPSLVSGWSLL